MGEDLNFFVTCRTSKKQSHLPPLFSIKLKKEKGRKEGGEGGRERGRKEKKCKHFQQSNQEKFNNVSRIGTTFLR